MCREARGLSLSVSVRVQALGMLRSARLVNELKLCLEWPNIIRKTCPCYAYPLQSHFYIAKLGYAGVYLFFLVLLQNIDCGYSLEPPRRGGSNVYPQSMFWTKIRKIIIKKNSAENFQFLKLKKSLFIAWESFRNVPYQDLWRSLN